MPEPEIVRPWYNASANDGSTCFETQFLSDGTVQTRNSRNPDVVTAHTAAEWDALLAGVKRGEFDPVV